MSGSFTFVTLKNTKSAESFLFTAPFVQPSWVDVFQNLKKRNVHYIVVYFTALISVPETSSCDYMITTFNGKRDRSVFAPSIIFT